MIDTQSKLRNIQVGHRVQVQDNAATVKYIGNVDGHKGLWLGLDWDDPSRGKHDGSVNGKQYFTASTPTSGSFLHPEKVTPGITLIESITSRYGHQEDEEEIKFNQAAMIKLAYAGNMPFLECVGFDKISTKQSNYMELKVLNVRMEGVSQLGDVQQFSAMCPNVEELDLSKNLIHSWRDVFDLVIELKHLNNLNVSQNKLEMPEDTSNYKIPHLKTLICGQMELTIKEIETLATVFPNLETLITPNNNISHFSTTTPPEILFSCLNSLDIDENLITEWSEIMKLKNLPNLQHLSLSNLQIPNIRIEFDDKNPNQIPFKHLQSLNIKYNKIADLESLSNLNRLKNLSTLGLSNNPLCNIDSHRLMTQIIVGMIGSLRLLNGSDIQDRKGAEIDYMKKYGLEWLSIQGNEEAKCKFLKIHTRYPELIMKYGELELCELKEEAKTIQESLLELNLVYEGKLIKKKVPPSLEVQKLVTLCQRLFRLSAAPTLIYVSSEQPGVEYVLEENREISMFSVQTGDKIVVKS